MVSYCFIFVCEKLWWTYILKKGGDRMNELYHYGVKGMKWGVRRYQNENGSLTEAGKKRLKKYVNENGELTAKGLDTFGKKVRAAAYRKEVKDNRKNFYSEEVFKEFLNMTEKMDRAETERLSKKGKIFVDEVLKNVDLKKYGTIMSLDEIEEDFWIGKYDKD